MEDGKKEKKHELAETGDEFTAVRSREPPVLVLAETRPPVKEARVGQSVAAD